MYGSLTYAFVEAIRAFPAKRMYGLNVIQVNDAEGKTVVNTALPCVTISLLNAKKPTTFIGGGIYENPRINVQVIVDFANHSLSADGGVAVKFQNLAYEIRRYVEQQVSDSNSKFFKELRSLHGFSAVYDEMKTYTSMAWESATKKQVLVYSMTWLVNSLDPCSVEQIGVELEAIESVVLEDHETGYDGDSEVNVDLVDTKLKQNG